jgi:hypothetical protein
LLLVIVTGVVRYQEHQDFATETEFRVGVYSIALNETWRMSSCHRFGKPRFQRLPADQRRLLGMRYLDQLPPGDVAGVLRLSADEVRERVRLSLHAFFRILGRPDVENES